jgi:hypothetical protein
MSKYLDLDDVVSGNPVAEKELAELRARLAFAEALLTRALPRLHASSANDEFCYVAHAFLAAHPDVKKEGEK